MMTIIRILGTALFQILLPFLAGMGVFALCNGGAPEVIIKKVLYAKSFVFGYLMQLAVFFVVANPMINTGRTIQEIIKVWMIVELTLTVLILAAAVIMTLVSKHKILEFWDFKAAAFWVFIFIIVFVGTMVIRVLVGSSPADTTLQDALYVYDYGPSAILKTDTFTGLELAQSHSAAQVCLTSFYAALSVMSGIIPVTVIRIIVSPILMFVCMVVFYLLGQVIWPNNKKALGYWFGAILFIYIVTMFSKRLLMVQLLSTTWNGQALWAAIIVPLGIAMLLSILEKQGSWKLRDYIHVALWFLVLLGAGNMFVDFNDGAVLVYFLLAALAAWMRRFVYHD